MVLHHRPGLSSDRRGPSIPSVGAPGGSCSSLLGGEWGHQLRTVWRSVSCNALRPVARGLKARGRLPASASSHRRDRRPASCPLVAHPPDVRSGAAVLATTAAAVATTAAAAAAAAAPAESSDVICVPAPGL